MADRKAAIVTGSTSGIGLGIAEALAHAGLDAELNAFGDASEIETLRSELEKSSGATIAVFLASDAAAQITGAALPVDGGWIAQ